METLEGRVAVVTGAASGIGRALAGAFASEGMRVVLADVDEAALEVARAEVVASGVEAIAVPTDVSKAGDVEALAAKTVAAFGGVHVLCNNAGVAVPGTLWETPLRDWEWTVGVNLWGVVHGVRTFVPIMLEGGEEGHIVNTASAAGIVTGTPRLSVYAVTKHAVVALSESLAAELASSRIGVSVLCPHFVKTRITWAERNRPSGSRELDAPTQDDEQFWTFMRQAVESGMAPDRVARLVVRAIQTNRLYVLPHATVRDQVRERMQAIVEDRSITL